MALRSTIGVTVLAGLSGCLGGSRSAEELSAVPSDQCERECLVETLDAYLQAMIANDTSLLVLSTHPRLTENGKEVKLGEGLWRTARQLGNYRAYIVDSGQRGVAVQTVLFDGSTQVQLMLRLKVVGRRISEVETLIARQGDTCCWDPARLDSLSKVFEEPIPPSERHTREELIAVADAYFTALHTAGTPAYRRTVVAAGMNRYENGKRTTNVVGGNPIIRRDAQAQLDGAMFGRISVVNRRYSVVDIERGTLLGTVVFEYPDSDRPSEIISELVKIRGGVVQEIRAVMVKLPSSGWPSTRPFSQ